MAQTDSKALPDAATLSKAAECDVLDVAGNKVKFGTVFEAEKTILVFVRHFFCGSCKQYIEQLASVPKDALAAAKAKIVVIGCGEWKAIAFYAKDTGFTGTIYTDPSYTLYRTLGMTTRNAARTPTGQEKRSYLTLGTFTNVVLSTWRTLSHPLLIGKQGNWFQLGGDFVFGPGLKCVYASRMQHTEDHVEVADLMKVAGIELSKPSVSNV